MDFSEHTAKCPVIAILRGVTPDEVVSVVDVLVQNGITLVEVPLNSPDACESIRRAADAFHPSGRALIGAGTVLTPEEVRQVAAAGGKYIISPNVYDEVIRETKKLGLVSIPGFMTPSEAFAAIRAGADCLKLFPAGGLGTTYVKDIKAVIKKPIMAVGGITLDNAKEFLKVTVGLGIGSALYKPGKTLQEISSAAAAFAAAVR